MSARVLKHEAAEWILDPDPSHIETTLLELVTAVAESAESDEEVIATLADLLNSGRVVLVGNFRAGDVPLD